ncbi:hypothetical protein FSST1_006803 [Fusarium sambucinum]
MPIRPYRPKVKGCYECSQRRVNCDRGVPECNKCITKGIKCSSLGIRHRFSDGVASRGHCVGKTMDAAYPQMKKKKAKSSITRSKSPPQAVCNTFPALAITSPGPTSPASNNPITVTLIPTFLSPFQVVDAFIGHNVAQIDHAGALSRLEDLPTIQWDQSCQTDALSFLDIWNQEDEELQESQSLSLCHDTALEISDKMILPSPHPDHVPAWKRRLMFHFSSNIAGEMIAVDGPHNGWRHLVLPVADRDELVMDAVLAVSLFHCPNVLQYIPLSERPNRDFYSRAIKGLQLRSQLHDCDQHSIILTILLLLTAVMVNGSSDFPILFGLLQSAIDAMGGDAALGSGGMAEFLIRQVRKFKVYAAPLLTEHNGIDIISSEAEVSKMFECLNHCLKYNPQHSHSLGIVLELVQQACEIYLSQVALNSETQSTPQIRARRVKESIRRVQRFIDTFEAFPEDAPGKQVLVWATFIAALDCRLADHKEWFSAFLLKHYARNGFQNTSLGLEALRKVWSRKPEERWSTVVAESKVFIM